MKAILDLKADFKKNNDSSGECEMVKCVCCGKGAQLTSPLEDGPGAAYCSVACQSVHWYKSHAATQLTGVAMPLITQSIKGVVGKTCGKPLSPLL